MVGAGGDPEMSLVMPQKHHLDEDAGGLDPIPLDAVVLVGLDIAIPGIDCDHALHLNQFCRQLSDRPGSLNLQGDVATRFCDAAGLAGSPCSDELSAISRSTDDSRSIEAAGAAV